MNFLETKKLSLLLNLFDSREMETNGNSRKVKLFEVMMKCYVMYENFSNQRNIDMHNHNLIEIKIQLYFFSLTTHIN